MKIEPKDLEVYRLMKQRQYYREHKIPALVALLDQIEELFRQTTGKALDLSKHPNHYEGADGWLVAEHLAVWNQQHDLLDSIIPDLEERIGILSGRTADELDALVMDIEQEQNEDPPQPTEE